MLRILSLLLLSLVLLTTACSKDDPQPEPALTGRWNYQGSKTYQYSSTNQLLSQQSTGPEGTYMVVTDTTLSHFDVATNHEAPRYRITRKGNVLETSVSGFTIIVEDLTDKTLTLRYENQTGPLLLAPGADHATVETYYTR